MNPVPLLPGMYYHIYNRGNNRENIFGEEKNYFYFLRLYARHIEPVAETYAYCLLGNHFHFLIRVREEPSKPPSRAFSNLFNAYARAFNKTYGRTGALFQRPFQRIQVITEAHLYYLVIYIHRNPRKHDFVDDFREWPFSSYQALISDRPTRLRRDDVLAWFGGRENLIASHLEHLTRGNRELDALTPEDWD